MHILLTNVHLDCRGEGSSNRNASWDEFVETGDESDETGDESIEAGEKHHNHVIMVNNACTASISQGPVPVEGRDVQPCDKEIDRELCCEWHIHGEGGEGQVGGEVIDFISQNVCCSCSYYNTVKWHYNSCSTY